MIASEGEEEANPPVRRLADWNAERLRDLADEHGTPLYVDDLQRVRENYARISAAFPDADVHYAAKANTGDAVLRTLAAEGAGVECASAGEVHRALEAGFDPERVHYTAVNPPADDLDYAVNRDGITITVGARDTVERLRERGFEGRLCLRVNPGVGAGHHEKVRTGADAKFGVPYDGAADLLGELEEFGVVGIHAHAGSGISGDDLSNHRELVRRMGDLARDAPVDLAFVDIGGGFGVPYRPAEPPLGLDSVAEATREALGEVPGRQSGASETSSRTVDADLVIEPGRYLVADAGVLLTRVNTVKNAPDATVVGVDAGMTTLARPAFYDAYHHVRNLAPDAGDRDEATVTLTGPICESADVFGDYALPRPARGDPLAIGNAGAYGYEMTTQYNSRPRPAAVAVDGDRSAVARRRETIADVCALSQEVSWL